MAIKPDAAK